MSLTYSTSTRISHIVYIKHNTKEGESRREKQDVCAQVGVENVDREQWVFGLAVCGRRAQRGGSTQESRNHSHRWPISCAFCVHTTQSSQIQIQIRRSTLSVTEAQHSIHSSGWPNEEQSELDAAALRSNERCHRCARALRQRRIRAASGPRAVADNEQHRRSPLLRQSLLKCSPYKQPIKVRRRSKRSRRKRMRNLYQSQVRAPYSKLLLFPFLHPARSHDGREELADTLYSIDLYGKCTCKFTSR